MNNLLAALGTLLRRAVAVVALAAGAMLAVLLAVVTFVAAITVGAALWLSARLGARPLGRDPGARGQPSKDVIDVEMREIEPEPREIEPDERPTRPEEPPRS